MIDDKLLLSGILFGTTRNSAGARLTLSEASDPKLKTTHGSFFKRFLLGFVRLERDSTFAR